MSPTDRPQPQEVPPRIDPPPARVSQDSWQLKHEATMTPRPGRPAHTAPTAPIPTAPIPTAPIPTDLTRAAREIRGWVAAERKPATEAERLIPANPADREHNARVSYTVNWALQKAGAAPGRDYPPARWEALAEKALWTVTALRQSDAKIGSSESLILRDAQRYLYGTLGDAWLERHVIRKYHVPPKVGPVIPGKAIDRGYEYVVKPADIAYNSLTEELTGSNPGAGRGKPGFPHSRPGGEAWYDRGQARRAQSDLASGPAPAPFVRTVPEPAPAPADTAAELAAPPGHVDLGHGESVNLETGRYTPGFGPKY
ncbi:hypothetical protein [Micromonospora sp. NPDC049171]|uniref:hypothetical protein n=1 Tax=Micromonospora sp. NPDC049171 TaxID=3155770 RepID=UPI003406C8B1